MTGPFSFAIVSPFVRLMSGFAALCDKKLANVTGGALDLVKTHDGFGRPSAYLEKWHLIGFRKYAHGE